MFELSVLFGLLVGLSLGVTGGGGSIFAVPLLVYGLSTTPREAVGMSLVIVGVTAFVGFLQRLRQGEVEARAGIIFALFGTLGAPVGALIGGQVPATVLLLFFSLFMVAVAFRMWRGATALRSRCGATDDLRPANVGESEQSGRSLCERDGAGRLLLSLRCIVVLGLVGLLTGVLSGLFGVGGGLFIVPALVFFTHMNIRRAVATSLFVIALISLSGVVSYVSAGGILNSVVALLFSLGGIVGLFLGANLSRRVSGPTLQRGFAAAMVVVAGCTAAGAIV